MSEIYPKELPFNKANTYDTTAPFLDLDLSISNGTISSKIDDKRDAFDFDIHYFPFFDGDYPSSYPLWTFYIATYHWRYVRLSSD